MLRKGIFMLGLIFSLVLVCLIIFTPAAAHTNFHSSGQLSETCKKTYKEGEKSMDDKSEPSFSYQCTELPANCVFAIPPSMGWERKHGIFMNARFKLINPSLDRMSWIFNFYIPEGVSQNDYQASEEDNYLNFQRFSSLNRAILKEINIDKGRMSDYTLAFIPDMGEGIFNHNFSYSTLESDKNSKFRCISIIIFSFDRNNLIGIAVEGNKDNLSEVFSNCFELRQLIGAKQSNGDILFGGGKSTFLLTRDLVLKQRIGSL